MFSSKANFQTSSEPKSNAKFKAKSEVNVQSKIDTKIHNSRQNLSVEAWAGAGPGPYPGVWGLELGLRLPWCWGLGLGLGPCPGGWGWAPPGVGAWGWGWGPALGFGARVRAANCFFSTTTYTRKSESQRVTYSCGPALATTCKARCVLKGASRLRHDFEDRSHNVYPVYRHTPIERSAREHAANAPRHPSKDHDTAVT